MNLSYGYQRTLSLPFEKVDERIRETLKDQGFGVITEIDVSSTFKAKLNIDFKRYKILGACHPPTALKALTAEPEIGLLLPCNITIWENDDQSVTLSAIDAGQLLAVTGRTDLNELASEVNQWLQNAVDNV